MAKILVVDDDPDFTETTSLVLQKAGHTVLTAANTAAARRALDEQRPGLLILDVMMESPDDGIVLARALRRDGNRIPILMLTNLPKVAGLSFAKDDEMIPVDELVEKPVAPQRLVALVEQLLDAKR